MNIASMVDLVDMIKHLDEGNERISDWVFTSDGKSIVIDLTSGEVIGLVLIRRNNMDTIKTEKVVEINGETSDGYHTFNELYHHRAVLFSVIVKAFPDKAWKSKQHNDGTMYDGMFIVGIDTPEGQATYHYDIDPYWDMFKCQELARAPKWDGHTPAQAIERIGKLEPVRHGRWIHATTEDSDWGGTFYRYTCSACNWSMSDNPTGWGLFCPNCGAKMEL